MWYGIAFIVGLTTGLVYNRARIRDLKRRNDNLRSVASILIRRERKRRNN